MYRAYTLHVDTDDPNFTEKLAKVLQDADALHEQDNDMELREDDGTETGRYIAGWES